MAFNEQLTDELLLSFLKEYVKKDKTSHARVHVIFKEELKMDMNIKSPYARLDALVCLMDDITRRHNLQDVFNSDAGKKNWVRFMLNALQPYRLRQHMRTIVEITRPELQNNPELFFEEAGRQIPMFESDVAMQNRPGSHKRKSSEMGHAKGSNSATKFSKQEITCFKCRQSARASDV